MSGSASPSPRTIELRRVVVTGLGFVTSVGQSAKEVAANMRAGYNGIDHHPALADERVPADLAGVVKGYEFPNYNYATWQFPEHVTIPRTALRSMAPNVVFGYVAMQEAIANAKLDESLVSQPRTGVMTASIGSPWLVHDQIHAMLKDGYTRPGPMEVVNSIPGTLGINISTAFKIRGSGTGFVSACSSSSHAVASAFDEVRLGRQDIMFAVGAEEVSFETMAAFSAMRALTTKGDPDAYPCAFDVKRDGFAPTGGAAVFVLEDLEHAINRGAPIVCEVAGYGQTLDGYNVMAPQPEGEGLARAMKLALKDCGWEPEQVDYINAHATATEAGDKAELKALATVFGANGNGPLISSTKSVTGHGLCLAGALEAGITCLAIRDGFVPVSAKITDLDPAAEGHRIVTAPVDDAPTCAISNTSAFGGANVALGFKKYTA